MSAGDALAAIKTRAEGHTPGPGELHLGAHWFITSGATDVVHMADDSKDSEANAELFLAAPRLLAALEAVEKVDKYHRSKGMSTSETCVADGWDMAISHVCKAIAEALS